MIMSNKDSHNTFKIQTYILECRFNCTYRNTGINKEAIFLSA